MKRNVDDDIKLKILKYKVFLNVYYYCNKMYLIYSLGFFFDWMFMIYVEEFIRVVLDNSGLFYLLKG